MVEASQGGGCLTLPPLAAGLEKWQVTRDTLAEARNKVSD
jgi:hypothetical protein